MLVMQPPGRAFAYDELKPKVGVIIGTRPGIVMLSAIIRELRRRRVPHFVLHTSQHYSHHMDRKLADDLELPEPERRLPDIRDETLHGAQTAAMLRGCEQVLLEERPRLVLVGGDANTNLAAALAARKLHIEVGHVEAGERSFDWRMPEEHNRVIVDHISDYLYATNEKARRQLVEDNVRGEILITGNPIVDATHHNVAIARRTSRYPSCLGLRRGDYLLLTCHREENVDDAAVLRDVVEAARMLIDRLQRPLVFVLHPRTESRLEQFGLASAARGVRGLVMSHALGYLDFLSLLDNAALAVTDSGGVQQESCLLGVPAVTLRETTEWTETVTLGANRLAGTRPDAVAEAAEAMLSAEATWLSPFGDGRSAQRIVDSAEAALCAGADLGLTDAALERAS
jgi:UDP-N-acetylglucosamine 2-epimerase (non-hydrolysing)